MRDLQLDGISVHTSQLTQRGYRAATCRLLLPITPENRAEMLAEFRQQGEFGKYSGLHISGIADPDFLDEFPSLLYLEITNTKRVNTHRLQSLTNLRGLRIENPGAGINFSWFPHLERFIGDWHADNTSVPRCQDLREMLIWQFKPRSADLTDLAGTTRLNLLHLTKTNITSLAGIESLGDLYELDIAYAPNLADIEPLTAINVRELSFSNVKKVTRHDQLGALPMLRRLKLSSCAPMPDLHWVAPLQHLDFFSFVETNVENGDLSPLLELPSLRYVGTMDKRHYSHKFDEINAILAERHR